MPSQQAQMDLIRGAYETAGLSMKDTVYCEAHGAGTAAGDPVEVAAIGSTIGQSIEGRPLIIGSAKSNIGHLESCANLAAIIKTVKMLEEGQIAPNFDFRNSNPRLDLTSLNLQVATDMTPFTVVAPFRRASVNAFGYGGTNGHAILDDAVGYLRSHHLDQYLGHLPRVDSSTHLAEEVRKPYLFVVSGKTGKSLAARKKSLAAYLRAKSNLDLESLAFTLNARRTAFMHRDFLVARDREELLEGLEKSVDKGSIAGTLGVAFCFTGQGAQWSGMGSDLIQDFPCFQQTIKQCEEILGHLGASWSLVEELSATADGSRVNDAEISQPLCTALQIGLVDLLHSLGIKPDVVFGYSSGEIAAAYASGALTREDAMKVAYFRGLWSSRIKQCDADVDFQGAMLAAGISALEAQSYLDSIPPELGQVVIACFNSPSSITLSGNLGAINFLQAAIEKDGHFARKLRVDVAYHSPHMQLIADKYREALACVQPRESSTTRFVSSLTGELLTLTATLDAEY